MEDYEINILRRNGSWKKVNPNDLIIDEINNESIEDNESNQKEKLKEFEDNFLRKKKLAEDQISKISKEKDMIEKTINVIKNLKSF